MSLKSGDGFDSAQAASDAIAEAVSRLEREEARLVAEYVRLGREIGRLRQARQGLKRQGGVKGAGMGYAERGELESAIEGVLREATVPLSRAQLMAALRQGGYVHSLYPVRMTKVLIAMVGDRRLRRLGSGSQSRYELRGGGGRTR